MIRRTALVAQREYIESIRTKAFWIGIFIMPLILVLSIVVPQLLEGRRDVRRYAVLDRSGWLAAAVEERAEGPDLAKVFLEVWRRQRAGKKLDDLPEVLQAMAPTLAMANDERTVEKIAQAMTALGDGAGDQAAALPDEIAAQAQDAVSRFRDRIRSWWKTLPPEQARELSIDLDKSRYQRIDVDLPENPDEAEAKLRDLIAEGRLFAAIVVPEDPLTLDAECKYVSNNLTDNDLRRWYFRLANEEVRRRRFETEGIDQETVQRIMTPLVVAEVKVGEGGREEAVATEDKLAGWAPVIFVYVLWLAIYIIAQALLTNTIEEKSNRIIEVLLSSVSPFELMSGKIFGIAMTGLTMILSWVGFFFLVVKFGPALFDFQIGVDLTALFEEKRYILAFVVYFLLGYLLYAAIFVAIGSVTNSLKEAQNLMMPMIVVLLVPLFAMMPIGQDPNGALARVLSYIPIYTPFTMMNRAAGPPTTFEYVTTTLLLAATVAVAFWAAAKVFRIGVLMTGKPPRVSEIIRWIRAPIGSMPATESRNGSGR